MSIRRHFPIFFSSASPSDGAEACWGNNRESRPLYILNPLDLRGRSSREVRNEACVDKEKKRDRFQKETAFRC